MEIALWGLAIAATIGSIACYILVLVSMFQHNETTRGVIYAVLLLACGIGALLAFLYGIRKRKEWHLETVTNVWGICILVNILAQVGLAYLAGNP